MEEITFHNPHFLWLLIIVPVYILWYVLKHHKQTAKMPFNLSSTGDSSKAWFFLAQLPLTIRMLALMAMIIALARPQTALSWEEIETEGIDIVLSMDVSGSMMAEDLKPNRLEAAKKVATQFINDRPNDRFGLVVYSAQGFTQCPLTTDHLVVKNLMAEIANGMIEDGTAIGEGLATAVNRLKDSEAKSKVVILLTDGYNTSGTVPPLTAAEIAKLFGVRVYTIGVGTNGTAPMKFKDPFGRTITQNVPVKIDEETLQEIAKITGGKYFRATDNKSLQVIYEEIDQTEKVKIAVTQFEQTTEEFGLLLYLSLGLLLVDFVLRHTVLKSIVS